MEKIGDFIIRQCMVGLADPRTRFSRFFIQDLDSFTIYPKGITPLFCLYVSGLTLHETSFLRRHYGAAQPQPLLQVICSIPHNPEPYGTTYLPLHYSKFHWLFGTGHVFASLFNSNHQIMGLWGC